MEHVAAFTRICAYLSGGLGSRTSADARDASALEERPDGVAVLPVEGVPIAPQVSRTANATDDAAHRVHDWRHSSSRGKCEGGTVLACATRVGAA